MIRITCECSCGATLDVQSPGYATAVAVDGVFQSFHKGEGHSPLNEDVDIRMIEPPVDQSISQ